MYPRTRLFEANLINHNGQPGVLIRDRSGLSDRALVIPQELVMLLVLCDGTRDVTTLATSFEIQTGLHLEVPTIERILQQLEEALLLDSPRATAAKTQALDSFRSGTHRPPSCAGGAYPADASELCKLLDGYVADAERVGKSYDRTPSGLISPHIDFPRGGLVYAETWRSAERALKDVEVVVILGTDHSGPDVYDPTKYVGGEITLTRQNYCTPFGVIPTSQEIVDAVATAIGPESAFAEELHHRSEHSIELALVWLQYFLGGRTCEIVPILCGSFQHFTDGLYDASRHEPFLNLIESLRTAIAGRKSLVVAAADLAHVGPAFGDDRGLGSVEKESLAAADASMLATAASGNADAFLLSLIAERDKRRVCGLPPIYLALKLLGGAKGELIDYAHCPADEQDTSVVSICGMLFS